MFETRMLHFVVLWCLLLVGYRGISCILVGGVGLSCNVGSRFFGGVVLLRVLWLVGHSLCAGCRQCQSSPIVLGWVSIVLVLLFQRLR